MKIKRQDGREGEERVCRRTVESLGYTKKSFDDYDQLLQFSKT